MLITTGPGEPSAGPWRTVPLSDFAHDLLAGAAPRRTWERNDPNARLVIAVDGRSGSGKSTLSRRLQSVLPDSALVEVDDVGWHAPMFDWADLMADGVLRPFRARRTVRYRPPAWDERDRPGAIEIPGAARILLVEGVGASQRALADLIDVAVWVQSDLLEAERRGTARDVASGVNGDEIASIAFWHAWIAQEVPFLAADRPWERAAAVVLGTPPAALDPDRVAVAAPIRPA